MRVPRGYVGYMAREIVKRLVGREMIETAAVEPVTQRVHQALFEELAVEDRINDKVREVMNQYADEIRRGGVSYQEMFKKIKSELVRREKVII